MTRPANQIPVRTCTLAIGLFLVVTMIGGWLGEVQIPGRFMSGDAAASATMLRENSGLFRLGFAAYLAEAFSDLVLAWLFYVLLRPVNRDLALLSAFFGLVSMALFAVTKMLYYSAPIFLRDSPHLAAFTPAQLEALARIFLSLYANLSGLFMLFYGTGWILRGWLTWRSNYLPRFLGGLMMLAGAGFVAANVAKLAAPHWSPDLLLAPMFLNAVVLAFWMLFKGVDQAEWDRATGKAGE